MKVIFEFDGNEEAEAIRRVVKAVDMAIVISEFHYNAKKKLRYWLDDELRKPKKDRPDVYDVIDKVFQEFGSLLEDQSITIIDIIT